MKQFAPPVSGSIPTIIRSFKSAVTKRFNEIRKTPGAKLWQRNYYEHIIQNENELNLIREYIANNPMNWNLDRENPDAGMGDAGIAVNPKTNMIYVANAGSNTVSVIDGNK